MLTLLIVTLTMDFNDVYITIFPKNYDKNDTCCICLDTINGEIRFNCCNATMHNACFCILLANGHEHCPLCRTPIEKYCYLTNDVLNNAELYFEKQPKQLEQVQTLKKKENIILISHKVILGLILLSMYILMFIIVFLEKRSITKS